MGSTSIREHKIFRIFICFALVSRQCAALSSNATHNTQYLQNLALFLIESFQFRLSFCLPATRGREKDRQNSNFIYHYNMVLYTEFNIVTRTVPLDVPNCAMVGPHSSHYASPAGLVRLLRSNKIGPSLPTLAYYVLDISLYI